MLLSQESRQSLFANYFASHIFQHSNLIWRVPERHLRERQGSWVCVCAYISIPRHPDMPSKKEISPIVLWPEDGIFRPSILLDREGSGFLEYNIPMHYFFGGAKSLKAIAKKQLYLFDPVISWYFMILETGIYMLKLHFGLPVTFAFHTSTNSTFVTDPVPCGCVLRAKRLGLWGVYHVYTPEI